MLLAAKIVLALIICQWVAQIYLAWRNQRSILAHQDAPPAPFHEVVSAETYRKGVDYSLAKSRFGQIEDTYQLIVLAGALFSGFLPWFWTEFTSRFGVSATASAFFMYAVLLLMMAASLPCDWLAQFRLEQRFGFNTSTQRLWWSDRVKGVLLGLFLIVPLAILILKLFEKAGPYWWVTAWASVLAFQLLMLWLAPVVILPLFNRFTPLEEGALKETLLELARRADFHTSAIQVMDGSKRSRHSNAFFTGFGKFRKIVLFDTLISQLTVPELRAVLAHEIGHYKKKHILKLMAFSSGTLLAGALAADWLARQESFYRAFGFEPGPVAPVFTLFLLLSGLISFWMTPLGNVLTRRFEYEADAFARDLEGQPEALIGALRKLHEKNLANLMPDPLYSGFYYSHPTLLERERALLAG